MITNKGQRHYIELCVENKMDTGSSLLKWKDEILTGMKLERSQKSGFQVSARSTMRDLGMPAIPKTGKRAEPKTSDDVLKEEAMMTARRGIAQRLGITLNQVHKYMEAGQIKVCKRCKEVQVHDRKGKYVRSPCRMCRKVLNSGKKRQ
jgi:hypothetical protein